MDAGVVAMVGAMALSAIGLTWAFRPTERGTGRAFDTWGLVETGVGLFLMLGMLCSATIQVLIRYALSEYITIPWTEEFARLLLVWTTFWGAAMVHRADNHISMAVVFDALPGWGQRAVRLFGDLIIAIVLVVVVWQGWESAQVQLGMGTVSLGLPLAVFVAAVPVCGALMLVHTTRLLLRRVRVAPSARASDQEG